MGLGVGIFLIALGAILTFAVNTSPSGLNIHVVGVILMCVGILGILLSLIYWESWGGRRGYAREYTDYGRSGWYARGYRPGRRVVEEEVVEDAPPPPGPPAPGPPPP